jgi:hypothetical protein
LGKLKSLWNDHRALFLVVVAILLLVLILLWLGLGKFLLPLLIAAIVLVVVWLLFDSYVRGRKRRKQEELDAKIAAKEGVDDRRREWTSWTKDLRKQGIDRYDLPFYLLVGEPQSGKSVMLHNSGLHFPFGQSRLSGPGGTRGCDWWFTEEAVILDLAGRLFTHEGGASDAAEWEAFLEMLANFRPLSPANGVLLVIPCDTLLEDSPETIGRKAGQIQDSLLTLVNKLEAQFPIYLVLTKADRIFGFAETVHRMDTDRRRQMFGWSRPAEDFEKPFNLPEFREAFSGLQQRAHLLRGQALSSARIPDALPEIDRLFAFPEEMKALQGPLEAYVQRIFTESSLVDRLFFRGIYLSSGLQKGAPIAKACAALLGGSSEADARDLEGLFSKQRAYFIQDLIQRRVFSERGLVRPTSHRVRRARQISLAGYGTAAAIALIGTVIFGYSAITHDPEGFDGYEEALAGVEGYVAEEQRDLNSLIDTLLKVEQAEGAEVDIASELFENNKKDFQNLYRSLFAAEFPGEVRAAAEESTMGDARVAVGDPASCSAEDLLKLAGRVRFLASDIDLKDEEHLKEITSILGTDAAGSNPLAHPITIQNGHGGSVPPSMNGWSEDLRGAAEAYCKLLDYHARGEIQETEPVLSTDAAPSQLEQVIRLKALGDKILATAHDLEAAGEAVRSAAGSGDSDPGESRYGKFLRLDKALIEEHAALEAEASAIRHIEKSATEAAYENLTGVRDEIEGSSGLEIQESSWSMLEIFLSRDFFGPGGGSPRVVWWREVSESEVPTKKLSSMKSALRRTIRLPGGRAGKVVKDMAIDGAGDVPEAIGGEKSVWGALEVAELKDLDPLEQQERETLRALCSKDVMEQTVPHPTSQLTVFTGLWASGKTGGTSVGAEVLRSKLLDLQKGYIDLYRAHDDFASLEKELTGSPVDAPDVAAGMLGLRARAVKHLVDYHRLLTEIDPDRLAGWRSEIETRLSEHLEEVEGGLTAAKGDTFVAGIDGEFINSLAAISSSSVKPALSSRAAGLCTAYLDRIQAELFTGWDRPDVTLERMAPELSRYLEQYQAVIEGIPEEHPSKRDAWLEGQLDRLLVSKMQDFEDRLVEYWNANAKEDIEDADLPEVARRVRYRFGYDSSSILRSCADDEDAPRYSSVTEAFESVRNLYSSDAGYPLENAEARILEGDRRLGVDSSLQKLEAMRNDGRFKVLVDLAKDVGGVQRRVGESQLVEAILGARSAQGDATTDDLGLGIGTYCTITLNRFEEVLKGEYSRRYEEAFESTLRGFRGVLLSEPFVRGDDDWQSVSLRQLDLLHGLLVPETGKLAELRRRFEITEVVEAPSGSESTGDLAAFHPLQNSSDLRQLEQFLLDLRDFLYEEQGGSTRLRDCKLSFTLSAPSGKGFWTDKRSNMFWWPTSAAASQEDLKAAVSRDFDWVFGDEAGLDMAWGRDSERPPRGPGIEFEIDSPLAPLILAWRYGYPLGGDLKQWELELEVSAPTKKIPMLIEFTRDLPAVPLGMAAALPR